MRVSVQAPMSPLVMQSRASVMPSSSARIFASSFAASIALSLLDFSSFCASWRSFRAWSYADCSGDFVDPSGFSSDAGSPSPGRFVSSCAWPLSSPPQFPPPVTLQTSTPIFCARSAPTPVAIRAPTIATTTRVRPTYSSAPCPRSRRPRAPGSRTPVRGTARRTPRRTLRNRSAQIPHGWHRPTVTTAPAGRLGPEGPNPARPARVPGPAGSLGPALGLRARVRRLRRPYAPGAQPDFGSAGRDGGTSVTEGENRERWKPRRGRKGFRRGRGRAVRAGPVLGHAAPSSMSSPGT